jgi:CRP-like cAMP-binding protein
VTSALDGRAYGYDAFAVGKTVLFHLSQERFDALISESNEYYSAFVRMVCDHLRVSIQNLIILRNRRPLHRLAQELWRLADRHGRQTKKGLVIDLRLSQEDTCGDDRSRPPNDQSVAQKSRAGWNRDGKVHVRYDS